jgi:hypothetical protein
MRFPLQLVFPASVSGFKPFLWPNKLTSTQLTVTLLVLMFWTIIITIMCWLNDICPIDF